MASPFLESSNSFVCGSKSRQAKTKVSVSSEAAAGEGITMTQPTMHHILEEIRPWSRHHARQVASDEIIEKSSAAEAILQHLGFGVGAEPYGADEPAPARGFGEEQAPAPGAVINSAPPGF